MDSAHALHGTPKERSLDATDIEDDFRLDIIEEPLLHIILPLTTHNR